MVSDKRRDSLSEMVYSAKYRIIPAIKIEYFPEGTDCRPTSSHDRLMASLGRIPTDHGNDLEECQVELHTGVRIGDELGADQRQVLGAVVGAVVHEMPRAVRVMLDTNVPVSVFLISPRPPPGAILRSVLAGSITVCFNERILAEYRDVLSRGSFTFDADRVDKVLAVIEAHGEFVLAG